MSKVHQQYLQLKKRYPNAILFFQLGDFYETFEEDALVVSEVCNIVLTSREMGRGNRLPLAGVPVHAADNYIAKLLKAGHRVALCQQIEAEPAKGAKIVQREVIRVVTPGTVVEPELLEDRANNYLAAVALDRDRVGLAYADVTTGEFAVTQLAGAGWEQALRGELERLRPAEVLVAEPDARSPARAGQEAATNPLAEVTQGQHITPYEAWHFQLDSAREALQNHYAVASLEGFGCAGQPAAIRAAGVLVQYLQDTQKDALARLGELRTYTTSAFMALDAATRRNLELTQAGRAGGAYGSLLAVLDRTVTSPGGRLLRRWLGQPLLDLHRLEARQEAVAELVEDGIRRGDTIALLRGIGDLERLVGRLNQRAAGPRDLGAVRGSLGVVPRLKELLGGVAEGDGQVARLAAHLDACAEVGTLVDQAVVANPPTGLGDGNVIRPGFSPELDDLLASTRGAREWMAGLEKVERERTGIRTLKVGYNKVFGYYIEVSKGQLGRVPEEYERKQTLANAERYSVPALKEYEAKVLGAEDRMVELEYALFQEIRQQVAGQGRRIQQTAESLATLDVLLALADLAHARNYVCPQIEDSGDLVISEGRHPVIETLSLSERFVANDVELDTRENQLLIITGPNMAGKSTFMRQVALITLMAQMGSLVPARQARIGVVDRIFTRVGASDNLARGQSTFMVEMTETANILHNATANSLVLMDEIGRGTSTFDGLSLAWACAEHLARRVQAFTLFATHYFELTTLADTHGNVANVHLDAVEHGDGIVFLHAVKPGPANQSYGLQVAQLAGVPREVIQAARARLRQLEQGAVTVPQHAIEPQLALFDTPRSPIEDQLDAINIDDLSPRAALDFLYRLKAMLDKHGR